MRQTKQKLLNQKFEIKNVVKIWKWNANVVEKIDSKRSKCFMIIDSKLLTSKQKNVMQQLCNTKYSTLKCKFVCLNTMLT